MKRTIALGAVILAAASALAASAPPPVPKVLAVARPAKGEWFGLYVLGQKAGWAFSNVTDGRYKGQPAIALKSEVMLSASVGGIPTQRRMMEERWYERKDGGRLLGFRLERAGDGGDEVLVGECSPSGIRLTRKKPGAPDETRKLPPTFELAESADAARLVAASGAALTGKMLDLEETLQDKSMTTTKAGEGTYLAAGVAVKVTRVRTVEEKSNLVIETAVAADGRVLEVRFGDVMVGKAKDEATAKRLDQVDLFSLTRIRIDGALPKVARDARTAITYRVEGLAAASRKETPRQHFTEKDGQVLLTLTPRFPSKSPVRPIRAGADSDLADALRSTLAVESQAPAIVAQAKKIVGGEKDAWAAAQKLNRFVNTALEKTYGSSNDRATGVLAAKRGDCTEHSLLLTALARSVGIPARRVDGLVYMEAADAVPAFYWHEWVEVYVGEWIEIDPTFNQAVADATHIALGSEGRSDVAGLIGQIKLKVLEVRAPEASK